MHFIIWTRWEALKDMVLQINASNVSRLKLASCLACETNSDTHIFDISGVASVMTAYAISLRREASGRRRDRRARRAIARA